MIEPMPLPTVTAETVREESIALALSFPADVVYAVFTAFPPEAERPIEVRVSGSPGCGYVVCWTPGLHATLALTSVHHNVTGLAQQFARFLVDHPTATQREIRDYGRALVPTTA